MGDEHEHGIESYDHVPQQSRRDKLREQPDHRCSTNFLPFYDPSSNLISQPHHHNPIFSSRFQFHQPFFDPQIQSSSLLPQTPNNNNNNNNNNPLLLNHCYAAAAADVVPFKPEPLSLSLSSHSHPYLNNNNNNNNNNNTNNTNNVLNNLPKPNTCVLPLGPFTGYASILKGSRFLKPAQHLLEELCDVVGLQGIHSSTSDSPNFIHSSSDTLSDSGIVDHPLPNSAAHVHVSDAARANKSTLLSMLDEVYRKYKQYYQQIQEVMTSFEYISGLGNAAPYANQAIKAMYKHFKCLKNAILDQLQFNKKTHGDYSQRSSVQNPGFLDHQPVWRPQRGLPERAVTVLRAWLFEHFLHPYPSDTDKLMLAKQTGLSRSQVSNWFINARVRLWKPMVEEIYMLETKQTQKNLHRDQDHRNAIRANDHHPSNSLATMDNPSTSAQQIQDTPPKRTRNDPHHDMPMGNQDEPLNVPNYSMLSHHHAGANTNANMMGNNGGVSLTLGLHQNNVIGGFSEPFPVGFPVAATRRFGLGIQANNDGYVMGGHFGRDVIGGQLLHDFVG